MKTKTRSQLLTAIIVLLFPIRAFSQVSLPFVLGKEYFRSEITAVIGAPERFGYDLFAGEDNLDILMYGKGIIINQLYTNLNLRWVSDKNGIYPIVNFQSGKFTKRRAPLNGIALTDPTYRILEDKIPGGLYVGMPRTALKAIEGEHTDGRPGIHENSYRIVLDDDTMVLMYYNAWDRVTFIEYINHRGGIFFWPKEDPYTPVDEKDSLVTTFHGPDDLRGILVPSDPVDAFAHYSEYNLQDAPAGPSGSGKVSLPILLDFANQMSDLENEKRMYVQTPFRQDGWRGLKAVLHDSRDNIDWDTGTAVRWTYIQQSNRAILKDYILTSFARKGFESGRSYYNNKLNNRMTKISLCTDFHRNIQEIRIYHGGRIFDGRLLKRGEGLQPGEKYRFVTVYKEIPRSRILWIKRKSKREIVGTYCIAEQNE